MKIRKGFTDKDLDIGMIINERKHISILLEDIIKSDKDVNTITTYMFKNNIQDELKNAFGNGMKIYTSSQVTLLYSILYYLFKSASSPLNDSMYDKHAMELADFIQNVLRGNVIIK